VQGDVDLYNKNLTKIPFKFRKVTGNFNCSRNQLKSLNGCPSSVSGGFYCHYNQLTSLNGCPSSVDGYFFCYDNLKDFTELDIENAMRASKIKNSLSSQTLETFSDIIDEL
jgi:hypothetical protein